MENNVKTEQCVCGHAQQKEGLAWKTYGGIHSVAIHYGKCNSKSCNSCNCFVLKREK